MAASAYKAFERFFNSFRMFWGMTKILIVVIIIIQAVTIYFSFDYYKEEYFGGNSGVCLYLNFLKLKYLNFNNEVDVNCSEEYSGTYDSETYNYYFGDFIDKFNNNLLTIIFKTFYLYLLYPLALIFFHFRNKKQTEDKVIRGEDLIRSKDFKHFVDYKTDKFYITNDVFIPEKIVNRHNFIIGKPGSGKSQLIYRVIDEVIENNYHAIIHDFKGEMISQYYNPEEHLIFNPLDERHVGWNLFSELRSQVDVDSFVSSLIPESSHSDNFWPISARQLLHSIISYAIINGIDNYKDLWELVNKTNDELLSLFEGYPECVSGKKLLTEAKTANNIMAVLSNYTKPIQYLVGTSGDFSIKKWIKGECYKEKKILFISNYAMIQETLKPFCGLFVDYATKSLCSMPDDQSRRIYFILDEFGQIGKIGSIVSLLTQSRSKGGSVFIAIQDVAQINSNYSQDEAKSIVNSCGNTYCFACSDSSTADFISKKIGSIEIDRTEESSSMGVSDMRDSVSQSQRRVEKKLVLPSEIMDLPSLTFYMDLTDIPTTKDSMEYKKYDQIYPSFVERKAFQFKRADRKESTDDEGSSTDKNIIKDKNIEEDIDDIINNGIDESQIVNDDEDQEHIDTDNDIMEEMIQEAAQESNDSSEESSDKHLSI